MSYFHYIDYAKKETYYMGEYMLQRKDINGWMDD
jgi:hypothetical protein